MPFLQRAAGGGIAAEAGGTEWTSEGERKQVLPGVCETEKGAP